MDSETPPPKKHISEVERFRFTFEEIFLLEDNVFKTLGRNATGIYTPGKEWEQYCRKWIRDSIMALDGAKASKDFPAKSIREIILSMQVVYSEGMMRGTDESCVRAKVCLVAQMLLEKHLGFFKKVLRETYPYTSH